MSISTVAFNTGLLGMYGYQLYNVYQEKSERSNSPLTLSVEPNIDPVNNDAVLEREIENELKPLIGNKQLILRHPSHGELNPEKAIAKATLTMPTLKEIVVNPDFYKKDKEACKALVKWCVEKEAKMYDHLYNSLLVKSIGQVAITAFSVFNNWSVSRTMGFSLFLQITLSSAITQYVHKMPNSVVSTSSANELIAARRIFKVLEKLYRPTSCLPAKEVEMADSIKKYMKILNQDIDVRKIEIDIEEEEERIQSLQDYFQPFINLELNSSK